MVHHTIDNRRSEAIGSEMDPTMVRKVRGRQPTPETHTPAPEKSNADEDRDRGGCDGYRVERPQAPRRGRSGWGPGCVSTRKTAGARYTRRQVGTEKHLPFFLFSKLVLPFFVFNFSPSIISDSKEVRRTVSRGNNQERM